MKRLTEKEEAIMTIIWQLEKAFVKEVLEQLPEPKPHINTVSTTMRRLVQQGYLKYEDFGTTHRYYPAISKQAYTKSFIKPVLKGLFGNSIKNVVAFFAEEKEISPEELKEIIDMIENDEEKK
ncbi:MAG: BlaI/MecI/CopY family transcriptional regulator [Saprospiraceae bacterium]|nr:BlaI/MecI/CopY family transcriptional regulator [Saprospiraceae bacterium]